MVGSPQRCFGALWMVLCPHSALLFSTTGTGHGKGKMKSSTNDKKWFSERCGELLVKNFPANISFVIDEALERLDLPNTTENRQEIKSAFRTANPNSAQYAAKTYDPFYERGADKNGTGTEKDRILGYTEINRQLRLQQVQDAIADAIINNKEIVPNPKWLDVFKYGGNYGPQQNRNQSGPNTRNTDEAIDEFDSIFSKIGEKPEKNEN